MSRVSLALLGLLGAVALVAGGCSCFGVDECAPPCEPTPPVCEPPPCAPTPVAVAPCETPPTPPPANCGEVWCYIRVPAQTRTVCEQVCVQPASTRQEYVPPETKEVCEQVCVKPEERRRIPIPAEYRTESEQICTCQAKCEWQRVECQPHQMGSGEQVGECWKLNEIPAVYETRCRQVCVRPESCREEVIPAAYENRTRTVTVREGFYKCVEVPPVYETRSREEVVAPARWEWRRTRECEVPAAAYTAPINAPAPAGDPYAAPAPYAPAPEMGPAPAPVAPAPGDLPPAGGYEPDAFSSGAR